MFKRPYSNINPTGTLVQKTFGTEYNTVALVAGELDKLRKLHDNLIEISFVFDHFNDITNLNVLKEHILYISKNFDEIIKANDFLEYLQDNYPTLIAVRDKLNQVTKLQKENEVMLLEEKNFIVELSKHLKSDLDKHTKEKINELTKQFNSLTEKLTCKVKSFECQLNDLQCKVDSLSKLNSLETSNTVLHLIASDLVTKAIDASVIYPTDYLPYVNDAEQAIQKSEKAGNDESFNRKRMQHYFTGEDQEYWVIED